MSGVAWLVVGVIVAFMGWRLLFPGLDKAVKESIDSQDISPLVTAINKRPINSRPAAFNHAIKRMWDAFQRPMAIQLVKELVKDYGNKPIAQYWIKQVLQIEPRMAKKSFSKRFLQTYYRPELASKCGPVG